MVVLFPACERIGVALVERADDAGAVGWWGTWTVTLMVLALIGIAVGDELAIGDDATLGFTLLTFGGPVPFLLAQVSSCARRLGRSRGRGRWAWRRWRSSPSRPHRSR